MSTTKQDYIIKALYNEWTKGDVNLVNKSYGLNFKDFSDSPVKVNVSFFNDSSDTTWARTSGTGKNLFLEINSAKLDSLDTGSSSGSNSAWEECWDGVFAHEFTHLAMQANIENVWSLPSYFIEGSAVLTVGGDTRESTIIDLLMSSRSKLESVYSGNSGDYYDNYGGGYMLLRYYAKQSAKYTGQSQVTVMHNLVNYLVENGGNSYDDAIKSASNGFFTSEWNLIDTFTSAVVSANINDYSDAEKFIKDVAGINFDNDDTGAITGSDAGGSSSKNYENIVPESSSPSSWSLPDGDYTSNGLKMVWPLGYYLKNKTGVYLDENSNSVTLLSNYNGSLDFSDISAVVNLDASAVSTGLNFFGNENDNNIKGSETASNTICGGEGYNTLTGGNARDQFWYSGEGWDSVTNFSTGNSESSDVLVLSGDDISSINRGVYYEENENGVTGSGVYVSAATSTGMRIELRFSSASSDDAILYSTDGRNISAAKISDYNTTNLTYSEDVNYYQFKNLGTVDVNDAANNNIWLDGSAGKNFVNVVNINASSATGQNILAGNAADNWIAGGAGTSSLWGGNGGNDTLIGGSGVDMFWYGKNDGADLIGNASSGDVVNLYDVSLSDIVSANVEGNVVSATFNTGATLQINSAENVSPQFRLVDGAWRYNHAENSWQSA